MFIDSLAQSKQFSEVGGLMKIVKQSALLRTYFEIKEIERRKKKLVRHS